MQSCAGRKEMDETLFVPLYTSTLQDGAYGNRDIKRVPETEELSSEENLKEPYCSSEMKDMKTTEVIKKHDWSFDRYFNYIFNDSSFRSRKPRLRP
jgi:hypothetical protein